MNGVERRIGSACIQAGIRPRDIGYYQLIVVMADHQPGAASSVGFVVVVVAHRRSAVRHSDPFDGGVNHLSVLRPDDQRQRRIGQRRTSQPVGSAAAHVHQRRALWNYGTRRHRRSDGRRHR